MYTQTLVRLELDISLTIKPGVKQDINYTEEKDQRKQK